MPRIGRGQSLLDCVDGAEVGSVAGGWRRPRIGRRSVRRRERKEPHSSLLLEKVIHDGFVSSPGEVGPTRSLSNFRAKTKFPMALLWLCLGLFRRIQFPVSQLRTLD